MTPGSRRCPLRSRSFQYPKIADDGWEYRSFKHYIANEMKQLHSAITHEDGEPTYMGDGMYLFPDGRIREL